MSARISNDDAALGIGSDAVGANHVVIVGRANDDVDDLGPESALGLYFVFIAEHALETELAPTVHQQVRDLEGHRFFLLALVSKCRRAKKKCGDTPGYQL